MSKYMKKATNKKCVGAVWSNNMAKAEQTIKKMSADKKKKFFKKYGQ
jgi:hypothetical protein